MIGFVRYIDEDSGELVVDFNLAFNNDDGSQGDILLTVPTDSVVISS
jgi:hypothetical protein